MDRIREGTEPHPCSSLPQRNHCSGPQRSSPAEVIKQVISQVTGWLDRYEGGYTGILDSCTGMALISL